MTAKERLIALVDTFDEQSAEYALQVLEDELAPRLELTEAQRASVERGLAQLARGEGIPHAEVVRSLGLDH